MSASTTTRATGPTGIPLEGHTVRTFDGNILALRMRVLEMRGLVTYLLEDQRYIRSIIQTVFLMKALERIGHHARNIALCVPRLVRRGEGAAPPADEQAPGAGTAPRVQSSA